MINLNKILLSLILVGGISYSTSLDDVVELSGVVSSSEYSAEANSSDSCESIFASKKTKGMELIVLNKKEKKQEIDISLKDVISQIVGEQNSENTPVVVVENNNSIETNSSKDINLTSNIISLDYVPTTDRALELDYKSLNTSLKKFIDSLNSEKFLYLTFDDGPLKGTENVLKILEEEKVEATMFCVGKHILRKPDIFTKEKNMSNLLVVNHTFSHANGHYRRFYSHLFGVMSDIEHNQLIVGGGKFLRLAGRNVWRLPEVKRDDYGLPRRQRAVEIQDYNKLAQEGFFIVGWDVEWGFNHRSGMPTCSAKALASRIEKLYKSNKLAKRGRVVLLTHDFMFRSKESANELREFIKIMKQNGWKFKKVNHYVSIQPEPLRVAKYYKPNKKSFLAMKSNVPKSSSLHSELNNALKEYDAEKVNHILDMGINPNRQDKYGRLALNTAIEINSIKMVKKLISHGAKVTAHDKWGNTPLSIAKRYKRKEIIKYLQRFVKVRVAKKHPIQRKSVVAKAKKKRDALSILRVNPL